VRSGALAALLLLLPAAAGAHQRSQSFSSWQVEGPDVHVVFTVLALEATRLGPPTGSLDALGARLAEHLAATVQVRRGGERCLSEAPPRPLRARPGHLRVEARFRCALEGALEVESHAFFDVAPSHVHFARVASAGERPRELLFTDALRVQTLVAAPGSAGGGGARFGRYVALGMEHILGGSCSR
jgi:hypothetical protein